MKKDYQAISESISEILGTRQSLSESLIDEGIRALAEKRVKPKEEDTPKTVAGRVGLNTGRAAGGFLGGELGAGIGSTIGALGGAFAGRGAYGLGARAMTTLPAGLAAATGLPASVPVAPLVGAGIGALAGGLAGRIGGTAKGIGLGGRTARYFATGSTKLPSERKKKKVNEQQSRPQSAPMSTPEPGGFDLGAALRRKTTNATMGNEFDAPVSATQRDSVRRGAMDDFNMTRKQPSYGNEFDNPQSTRTPRKMTGALGRIGNSFGTKRMGNPRRYGLSQRIPQGRLI